MLFKCAYNIDFPIYYEAPTEACAYIAVKDDGWIKDDPAKMIVWISTRKDPDGQLFRMIKFTKAWASERSFKMPSGIALAVWVARNFKAVGDRDDLCLLQVLEAIKAGISGSISCPVASRVVSLTMISWPNYPMIKRRDLGLLWRIFVRMPEKPWIPIIS